ncbi:hypothetical protein [Pyrococcus kukulkanii]|uniref:hypothetical protein n=1 Tax=Pyrococcus kukulkanii TaxID=1609559 RepID=UPI0035663A77
MKSIRVELERVRRVKISYYFGRAQHDINDTEVLFLLSDALPPSYYDSGSYYEGA